MVAIAAFAGSEQGKMFAAAHDRFGADPAGGFRDDVLAANFRAVLMFAYPYPLALPEETEPDDEWAAAGAANERAWLGG